MGCAVQLHQSSTRRASWAENSIDGWYLQTSPEHYQCHVIYVKQTKSERVSDTVFFKTKYITEPTMTPADIITKALNDLTQALKVKNNVKGLDQIKALKKLNDILNNTPVTAPTQRENPAPEPRCVTFNQAAKRPQESESNKTAPSPRVNNSPQCTKNTPITTATIDKPITNISTPRVHKTRSTATDSTPTSDKNSPTRIETKKRIREHLKAKTMARIPQQNMNLRRNIQSIERAQRIHDKETNTYLTYRQLLCHPKYKELWEPTPSNSSAKIKSQTTE
jgi:hypothetical protein